MNFSGAELTPHLLIQLEDDLERSRMREAFWISVVVHLMVVIVLVFSPKLFPGMQGVELNIAADLMRNQQMTYLDLPPDMQKAPKVAPKTDVLSDKNRIAESRHPTLDKKTLEELRRAGPPKMPSPPAQQAQSAPPRSRHRNSLSSNSRTRRRASSRRSYSQPFRRTIPACQPSSRERQISQQLAGIMSPGSSIEQAARAVASHRGGGSYWRWRRLRSRSGWNQRPRAGQPGSAERYRGRGFRAVPVARSGCGAPELVQHHSGRSARRR